MEGNERKSMEMKHGFLTQRSPEPEVKIRGVTVEQLITRSRVDCRAGGNDEAWLDPNRKSEQEKTDAEKKGRKQSSWKEKNRTLPTISNRTLQVYFILAPVPETLIIITISLQAVQNSIFQNRSLRVFDS